MDFRPMADRVLVRRAEANTKTSAGFIIPDSVAEQDNRGTVVAIGPGRLLKHGDVVPIDEIRVNDMVMYDDGSAIPVKVNGENLLVIKEENIIAIVGS